jgi:hypothetical protein
VKNLFATRVFWGAFFACMTAVTPAVSKLLKNEGDRIDNVQTIVLALAATGLTMTGRIGVTQGAFTPNWLPGPNKEDQQ